MNGPVQAGAAVAGRPPAEATKPARLSVVSFGPAEFDDACARLMQAVERDYAPTLIVGIRTGGYVVAQSMARAASRPVEVLPLTCRRAATGMKSRLPLLRTVLARLPRRVSDTLRMLEHHLVTSRRKDHARAQHVDAAEAEALRARLAALAAPRILVADDAVDSGRTLALVLDLVRQASPPGSTLRSAAITVTLDDPAVRPDYALHERVLCRFPWALDAGAANAGA